MPILGSVLDVDIGDVDSNEAYETLVGADDGNIYFFDEGLNHFGITRLGGITLEHLSLI